MIVLFNPWSTPSPKKPLPMSLLALGSVLEGEFDYAVVDGNIGADPVGRILAIHAATPLAAVAVTVMPGKGWAVGPARSVEKSINRIWISGEAWVAASVRMKPPHIETAAPRRPPRRST